MNEVSRPIIAITLVLCAVFMPVAFVSGLTGRVLSAVRAHDRHLDGDLGVQLADAFAGSRRCVAEAARTRSRTSSRGSWIGCSVVLQTFQPRLYQRRQHLLAYGDTDRAA